MNKDILLHQLTIAQRPTARDSSHCPLETGDAIDNYQVADALGQGRLSTVWACYHHADDPLAPPPIAIKVYREGHHHSSFYENEVKILNLIYEYYAANDTWPPHIIEYLGTFAHVQISHDLRPHIYPCITMKNSGDSLSTLIKFCKAKYDSGIPVPIVKKIMSQLLTGISHIHKCGVIHTDIKPSNILLNTKINEFSGTDFYISVADFGSSSTADEIFSRHVGTTEYIAPELLVGLPFGPPADVWSACVTCFELITGDNLFDVYDEGMNTYGDDVDGEAMDELIVISADDSSGNEDDIDEEKIIYRHLLLMVKILGYPCADFADNARTYFNVRGRLKNNPDVAPICISDFLMNNYQMTHNECEAIEKFLLCGLKYEADKRADAEGLMKHNWVSSCNFQL